MAKFVKKPVTIDAVQWTGDNVEEISAFFNNPEIWVVESSNLVIYTQDGDVTASAGDWIILGVEGQFYPCKPDAFAATYDPVNG